MKKTIIVCAFVLGLKGLMWAGVPSSGSLGAGIIIGEPFGPTVRYWFDSKHGFDAGIGFDDDLTLYADYLWESWTILPQPSQGKIGSYVGLGPRFEEVEHDDDDEFGIRTVAGMNYFFDAHPIELFGEIAPVFELTPDTDVDIDAGIGVRFYFSGMKP